MYERIYLEYTPLSLHKTRDTVLLVEATKFAPDQNGRLGGIEAEYLAKALRRHISTAIDFLLEYEQHPYQGVMGHGEHQPGARKQALLHKEESLSSQEMREQGVVFADAIGDDLDMLGIGVSFTKTWERKSSSTIKPVREA